MYEMKTEKLLWFKSQRKHKEKIMYILMGQQIILITRK
jgi:hypothetical protein